MPSNLLIGAHTSAAGGVHNALLEGQAIGATTIQLFTSNQKRWQGRIFTQDELDLWFSTLKDTGLKKIMSHDSYLINLGAPDADNLGKSLKGFKEEIERCQKLELAYLNFHPGAAIKEDPQECLDRIIQSVNSFEKDLDKGKLRILFEATAGQGSAVGYTFEQLGYLIQGTHKKVPIGICIDTCHIFAAGYDIRTLDGWDKVLKEFDQKIGLEHLYAFHVNDSLKPLGSRVDRHAFLGKGLIGEECFKFLVNDPRTKNLPMYLETPGGPEVWIHEIKMMRDYSHA